MDFDYFHHANIFQAFQGLLFNLVLLQRVTVTGDRLMKTNSKMDQLLISYLHDIHDDIEMYNA